MKLVLQSYIEMKEVMELVGEVTSGRFHRSKVSEHSLRKILQVEWVPQLRYVPKFYLFSRRWLVVFF